MIKIRTAQLAAVPSHIRKNLKQIEKEAALARAEGAHILVLPEMCLTGYLIGDIWDQNAFLKECERANEKVAALSKGLTIVWGSLAVDWDLINDDGRPRKYNAAFAASNGHFIYPEGSPLPFTVKTLLPDYRCFDDRRYFTSLESLALEEGKRPEDILAPFVLPAGKEELRCGIVLCEDSWDENYRISPMSILAEKGISLFLNLSASPFTMGKDGKRHRMFSESLSRLSIPMLYVNRRGLENNGKDCYTYDGMTAAYDKDGHLIAEANPFTDERSTFYFNQENLTLAPETEMEPTDENLLLPAFRYGTSELLKAIGASKVVIGVSGGIDSAVNAALYRSILPAENILLVNTPTRYNSELTKGLAAELAKNLGCQLLTVPIGDFIDETADALEGLPLPDDTVHLTGFMKENMQARDRSSRILAALSAAFGGIFTCNANKTETTVGYGTPLRRPCRRLCRNGRPLEVPDLRSGKKTQCMVWKSRHPRRHLHRHAKRRTLRESGRHTRKRRSFDLRIPRLPLQKLHRTMAEADPRRHSQSLRQRKSRRSHRLLHHRLQHFPDRQRFH